MPFALRPGCHAAVCAWLLSACTTAASAPHDRLHENPDGGLPVRPPHFDGGAPMSSEASTPLDAGGGHPLPNEDAGPAVSAVADLPLREQDSGAPAGDCDSLKPWTVPTGISSVSVIRGGDGFAGLLTEHDRNTGYVFDSQGNATLRTGSTAVFPSDNGYGLLGAGAGGGVTVGLVQCNYKFPCGTILFIAGERPRVVQSPMPSSPYIHVAVNGRGDIILANLTPPVAPGFEFDPSNQFYDVRVLDRTGRLTKSIALSVQNFQVIDMATGDAGTVLLLSRQADGDGGDSVEEVVISLDENLRQRGVTVIPPHRAARSLSMKGHTVVLSGTAVDPNGSRVWLDALDAVTLKEAWSAERVSDLGVGLAADIGPSGEIATLATTGDGDGFVVAKYDYTGVPDLADGALVAKVRENAPPVFDPGIAIQSDGTIFVTTPVGAFVACR